MSRLTSVVCLLSLLTSASAVAQTRVAAPDGARLGSAVLEQTPAPMVEAAALRPIAYSTVTVTAGADTSAAVNDYRRIQNALNAAKSGDTIILSGTFNFAAPFAAAEWAKGNDGVASTADDYMVSAPRGVSNVTLTASSLGSAIIQGPGDLAARDLEGFLVFDSSLAPGGSNQGWTISNLRILDFDLSIGFFNPSSATTYNNTTISNNFIRIPTDLNATAAPKDISPNIGIHISSGAGQSIAGNTFNIPGDGVSAGANTSSSVAIQSDNSGGAVYNGLSIANNVIHVLNKASGSPEVTVGIWENGYAHTSNISISNNTFVNDYNPTYTPGSSSTYPANLEIGFRITSHSSPTSTVSYSNNSVTTANIGFEWISGSDFTGKQPVLLTSNSVKHCATGVVIQSNGVAHLEMNTIEGGLHVITGSLAAAGGNPNGLYRNDVFPEVQIDATAGPIAPFLENSLTLNNLSTQTITATMNYWGTNLPNSVQGGYGVESKVKGNATYTPWLATGSEAGAGFIPFVYASTVGTVTTLAGTAGADIGSVIQEPDRSYPLPYIDLQMNGTEKFISRFELVTLDIKLGAGDDVMTVGPTDSNLVRNVDGGPGNDTLLVSDYQSDPGYPYPHTWNITGPGSGYTTSASSFVNFEALRGGSGGDTFIFGAGGSIALTVAGGLPPSGSQFTNILDNSAIPGHTITVTGPGTLTGFKGTATGIGGGFDNINLFANQPADLSVSNSGPATASAGTVISYTIAVNNLGPNTAIQAQLSDPLPAGTTFSALTAPAGWSCVTPAVGAGGTVTCTRLSYPTGASVFTLKVNGPAAPAALSNTASVSTSGTTDPTPGNNSSTATTNVVLTADLAITKTASATASQGGNITYNLTVTNNGPSPALNVSMSDPLPVNTTLVSSSQTGGPAFVCAGPSAGSNGTVTCTNSSLASGSSATFTIVAHVASNAPLGTLNNTATVTTTSTDPTTPNTATVGTIIAVVSNADLSVTQTAQAGTYRTNGQLIYSITAGNSGPSTASNVVVTDVLPSGTTFISATPSQGNCSGTTTVTCSLGTLANGAAATISLRVILPPTAGPVSNTASVSTTDNDPVSANNTSTASINVIATQAGLSVTETGPATTGVNMVVSYTITVTNSGPDPAVNVSLTDALPSGTTFSSLVSPAGWSCTAPAAGAAGTIRCTESSMAAGSSVFTFNLNAPDAPTTISNTISVSSNSPDPDLSDNSSNVNTNVVFVADLVLTNTATATSPRGGVITYILTLANNGPSAATDVTLDDPLPPNTTFGSWSQQNGPVFLCGPHDDGHSLISVTCTIASFSPGSLATFRITVSTSPTTPARTLLNTATVTTTSTDPTTPNASTAATTITNDVRPPRGRAIRH
jgi:uncharacterized repeat protein (TIGR01451 family)